MAEPLSDEQRLQSEIDETRQELGETVEALAHKADVKARTEEMVDEQKVKVAAKVEEGKARLQDAQAHLKTKADETLPPPAQEKLGQAQAAAGKLDQQQRIAAVAGAVTLAVVVLWLVRR